jgi:hypothetical protein
MRELLIICCMLLFTTQSNHANPRIDKNDKFSNKLSLKLEVNVDTLSKTDTLQLILTFVNTSGNPLFFYPDIPVFLIKSAVKYVFGDMDNVLHLDKNIDLTKIILLQKGHYYRKCIKICVNNKFFTKGVNKVFVRYRLPKNKNIREKYFYGQLVSNEVEFVLI